MPKVTPAPSQRSRDMGGSQPLGGGDVERRNRKERQSGADIDKIEHDLICPHNAGAEIDLASIWIRSLSQGRLHINLI